MRFTEQLRACHVIKTTDTVLYGHVTNSELLSKPHCSPLFSDTLWAGQCDLNLSIRVVQLMSSSEKSCPRAPVHPIRVQPPQTTAFPCACWNSGSYPKWAQAWICFDFVAPSLLVDQCPPAWILSPAVAIFPSRICVSQLHPLSVALCILSYTPIDSLTLAPKFWTSHGMMAPFFRKLPLHYHYFNCNL